nr:GATOR complex protein DEPDC5 isoform X3 [Halyomorpha halys]
MEMNFKMKLYKLLVHTKSFNGEDLLINPKDFPNLKKGDVIEIYHPEDEYSRLLLQVTVFKEDLQGRDVISIEQSIATSFQLRTFIDVYVNQVDPAAVALDSVEIIFKDQYLGRSEFWRLKNSLINSCVYNNKKIEFCGGSVRCQVYEMWVRGDRVACGVIVESTKVVFRSLTSMVYLFIQMSSEMWDFDIHGDLYFEKAINGFLADLFKKWKKYGSNHEVTIVLFSRSFYKANSLEEFPQYMRQCLQQDYRGRFYEDFYRVVVQNERYDDWNHTLIELRRLFLDYQKSVLEYNNRPNIVVPKATNSTAAQGNFLEVLNMSLNVFEKHYLDRSFDRTGQLSVVITPGVGVFEVDRELTNVTKQRVIDNGVGSDLVCLGEQPLHAVPLFKFHNKDASFTTDDYSMPHWINLSFYTSEKRVAYSNFIPRIKLPPKCTKLPSALTSSVRSKTVYEDEDFTSNVVDYQAYDDQVFTIPSALSTKNQRHMKKTSVPSFDGPVKMNRRKMSDPDIHYSSGETLSHSPGMPIPMPSSADITAHHTPPFISDLKVRAVEDVTDSPPSRHIGGNSGSPSTHSSHQNIRPGRALINPFDPSHITIKLTSNRRRWTHIFPKGPDGQLIQQHHYKAYDNSKGKTGSPGLNKTVPDMDSKMKPRPSILTLSSTPFTKKSLTTLLWGATGEQEWTPGLTTASKVLIGVDWKSLTFPACLPITTDYFPDDVCLKTDYVFSDYNLLPEAVNADYAQQRVIYRKPLSTDEVFKELISQRLAQGFQIIIEEYSGQTPSLSTTGSLVIAPRGQQEQGNITEYKLSIGRVFHRLALSGSEIRVTRYRPRHPYPPFDFHYRYRFQAPDHTTYDVSWISFTTEKLENFNWNYIDNYICTRGDTDFALVETLKYWRFRVYLIPLCQAVTKKILEGAEHCDIYTPFTNEERSSLTDNFLRFMEQFINKIKRAQYPKKPRLDLSALNVPNHLNRRRHSTGIIFLKSSVVGNSPFRERLGSNRLPEKPRPRSGSKVMDRGRASPAIDTIIPLVSDIDHGEYDQEASQCVVLKEGTPYHEIVEALKNPHSGISFLNTHPSFPSNTFVSADAVQWLIAHLEGVSNQQQAINILQEILNEKLICHASGDFGLPFIYGFYLYHVVKTTKDDSKGDPAGDLQGFENEWVEVEVKPPAEIPKGPAFLMKRLRPACSQTDYKGPLYKEGHLEIDINGKSDRVEWGHVKYHTCYRPDLAYEMVIKWAAASGAIVADLVFGWARKAQTCGLQMVPVPADPFALPYSLKSDPLRGPVFVPLETECLMGSKSYLFEEFEEESWPTRLVLFQEAIAINFGFFACSVEGSHQHNQYIHLSGNIFLLIPSVPCEHSRQSPIPRSRPVRRHAVTTEGTSPHHEYITRHVGPQPHAYEARIGFLWSWNHMVSRRWRLGPTNAIGDEAFQNKLLADFRAFCSNDGNRLCNFWESSWTTLQTVMQSG